MASRSDLPTQSSKKGARSKFVANAVKWKLLDQTVSDVRNAFSDMSPAELNHTIDKALASIRKEKRRGSESRRRK